MQNIFEEKKKAFHDYLTENKCKGLFYTLGKKSEGFKTSLLRIKKGNLAIQEENYINLIEAIEDLYKDKNESSKIKSAIPPTELKKFKYELKKEDKDEEIQINTVKYESTSDFIELIDSEWELQQEAQCYLYKNKFLKHIKKIPTEEYYLSHSSRANINPRISDNIHDQEILKNIQKILHHMQVTFRIEFDSTRFAKVPTLNDRAFIRRSLKDPLKKILEKHPIRAGFKFIPTDILVDIRTSNPKILNLTLPTFFIWSIKFGDCDDLKIATHYIKSETEIFNEGLKKIKFSKKK